MRVGRHAVDLDAKLLEFRVTVGQIAEFGRADEREVGRIEHDDGPLALEVFFRDGHEFALVIRGCLERFDLAVDDRHLVGPCLGVEEVDELCIFAIDLRKSINFIDVMRNGYGPDLTSLIDPFSDGSVAKQINTNGSSVLPCVVQFFGSEIMRLQFPRFSIDQPSNFVVEPPIKRQFPQRHGHWTILGCPRVGSGGDWMVRSPTWASSSNVGISALTLCHTNFSS